MYQTIKIIWLPEKKIKTQTYKIPLTYVVQA